MKTVGVVEIQYHWHKEVDARVTLTCRAEMLFEGAIVRQAKAIWHAGDVVFLNSHAEGMHYVWKIQQADPPLEKAGWPEIPDEHKPMLPTSSVVKKTANANVVESTRVWRERLRGRCLDDIGIGGNGENLTLTFDGGDMLLFSARGDSALSVSSIFRDGPQSECTCHYFNSELIERKSDCPRHPGPHAP